MTASKIQELNFPRLPAKHDNFIQYIASKPNETAHDLLKPYNHYDNELRKAFAQQPDHPALKEPNIVPVFAGHEKDVKIRARNLEAESQTEQERYIMPIKPKDRPANGSPAIVDSMQQFKTQFAIFSESALSEMDWSNVVAAGSAVTTSLLRIPDKHSDSKRSMRQWYHDMFAPASDVDLFIYGLNEEQAIEKIKAIERAVTDALLVEATCIRTKNAVTIATQWPIRHIQIVLRCYKSISEIITGFDVDCSCVAYDGKQVWASPRAMVAFMTKVNAIDLSRRSPSYELRLSKYAKRGWEVYWPDLDRSRVDPTIYERSFARTQGLARLLVLEKLPTSEDRTNYASERRRERGRPPVNTDWRANQRREADLKLQHEDDVADWIDEEETSNYHTFTLPYGRKYHAAKLEKLLYQKDLLLNAEWNKKGRESNLHRHPAFFGSVADIVQDCCGSCPEPADDEDEELLKTESKTFVSGPISFIRDDPGRQEIGSFNPLSAHDYTEMAYIGNTEMLCHAIVDRDEEFVTSWLKQEGNDANTRDHTGRTPLQLAAAQSSVAIVQLLIDHKARIVARMADGFTALHIASKRGDVEIVQALLRKSEQNEEKELDKLDARRAKAEDMETDDIDSDDSEAMIVDTDSNIDATTEGSMIKITTPDESTLDDDSDEPDVYDVNVLAWDVRVSPLHLAILQGHDKVVRCLAEEFGADVLLPVKLGNSDPRMYSPVATLLSLMLALRLDKEKAVKMSETLLELGATCAQADAAGKTALHYCVAAAPYLLDSYAKTDGTGVKRSIRHSTAMGNGYHAEFTNALSTAIALRDGPTALKLLELGADPTITFSMYIKSLNSDNRPSYITNDQLKERFKEHINQPIVKAVRNELPGVALALIQQYGVDVNTLSKDGEHVLQNENARTGKHGTSLLDEVRSKITALLAFDPYASKSEGPAALKSDAEYLSGIEPHTYSYYRACRQLKSLKAEWDRNFKKHAEDVKATRGRQGVEEQQAAVYDLISQYRALETVITQKSGKTFYELHPEIKKAQLNENPQYHSYISYGITNSNSIKWDYKQEPNATDELKVRYRQLFDAACKGDVSEFKRLTTEAWHDSDGQQQPPLRAAVQDNDDVSPFSMAVMHGDLEFAKTIMQIAVVQYAQSHKSEKKADIDEDDNSEDSDMEYETQIVDEDLTIDNIGEATMQIRNAVDPYTILTLRTFPLPSREEIADTDLATDKKTNDEARFSSNLIQWAISHRDIETLDFLIDLGDKYVNGVDADNAKGSQKIYSIDQADFKHALYVDEPQMIAHTIKRKCAGIPFADFASELGVKLNTTSQYYKGLSVKGKKRSDWAKRGAKGRRYMYDEQTSDDSRSPLLMAIRDSSMKSTKWLLSHEPIECYKQFADANPDDKRIVALKRADGGFLGMAERFIGKRSHVALHACIARSSSPEMLNLLRELLRIMPKSVNNRSDDGLPPLHVAFKLHHAEAAKVLIEAGADLRMRDKKGRNIIHHALDIQQIKYSVKTKDRIENMLKLIPKVVLKECMQERSTASNKSRTPIAHWISLHCVDIHNFSYMQKEDDKKLDHEDMLTMLLSYSDGNELTMIDGEGNSPLHAVITARKTNLARAILARQAELINRENTVGRTPYEVIEDSMMIEALDGPPLLPGESHHSYYPGRYNYTSRTAPKSITERESSSFVVSDEDKTETARLWELMRETKQKLEDAGKWRRVLVSLNEANEVAKRLAAMKDEPTVLSYRRGYYNNESKADYSDEVGKWMEDQMNSRDGNW